MQRDEVNGAARAAAEPARRRAGAGASLWRQRMPGILSALAVAAITLGSVFLPGAFGLDGTEAIETLLGDARDTVWAPFAIIAIFITLGLIGAPQFAMILVAAVILGPWAGLACSWIGTMISASIGFFLGKRFGARLLRRYGGARVNRLSETLGHHGILATMAVRNLPAGPFVFVNMVAGTSHMGFGKFLIGTGLGSLPKMLALSFLGVNFVQLLIHGDPLYLALTAAVALAWGGFLLFTRRWIKRSRAMREVAALAEADVDEPAGPAPAGIRLAADPPVAARPSGEPGTGGSRNER